MNQDSFVSFLLRAKQATYASGRTATASSRPNSHDLDFSEGDLKYIDSYLGGFHFIGEEAIWEKGILFWGMNYYGKMLTKEIPAGFGEFLKAALMRVPREAPYRGPNHYHEGSFDFQCGWTGSIQQFEGWEEIAYHDELVYRLVFHGGEIRD